MLPMNTCLVNCNLRCLYFMLYYITFLMIKPYSIIVGNYNVIRSSDRFYSTKLMHRAKASFYIVNQLRISNSEAMCCPWAWQEALLGRLYKECVCMIGWSLNLGCVLLSQTTAFAIFISTDDEREFWSSRATFSLLLTCLMCDSRV